MLLWWVPGRTLYHLHALGAAAGGGLDAVTAWLDRVADLGCGGVLLAPIHASSTHGYDTVDPFRVDDRLGGDAAFDRFLDAARERDLRVVLDGVMSVDPGSVISCAASRAFGVPPLSSGMRDACPDGQTLRRLQHR